MSIIEHAKKELALVGYKPIEECEDGPDKLIQQNLLELLEVFNKQDHSGFSAMYCLNTFIRLAKYQTLTPLTGNDDEWIEIHTDKELYQNNRDSRVFKDKNCKPYFLDAFVKRTPNGQLYSGSLYLKDGRRIGRCYIKDFSDMPTITIDVEEKEVEKDNWYTWVKDETQLQELAKYYDFNFK